MSNPNITQEVRRFASLSEGIRQDVKKGKVFVVNDIITGVFGSMEIPEGEALRFVGFGKHVFALHMHVKPGTTSVTRAVVVGVWNKGINFVYQSANGRFRYLNLVSFRVAFTQSNGLCFNRTVICSQSRHACEEVLESEYRLETMVKKTKGYMDVTEELMELAAATTQAVIEHIRTSKGWIPSVDIRGQYQDVSRLKQRPVKRVLENYYMQLENGRQWPAHRWVEVPVTEQG